MKKVKFLSMIGQERVYELDETSNPEAVACKLVELSQGMGWRVEREAL